MTMRNEQIGNFSSRREQTARVALIMPIYPSATHHLPITHDRYNPLPPQISQKCGNSDVNVVRDCHRAPRMKRTHPEQISNKNKNLSVCLSHEYLSIARFIVCTIRPCARIVASLIMRSANGRDRLQRRSMLESTNTSVYYSTLRGKSD